MKISMIDKLTVYNLITIVALKKSLKVQAKSYV